MVTGITGAGKSTACNFLVGEDAFEVDIGLIAVTSKSASHTTMLNCRKIEIIDTPGFCEDGIDGEENIKELGKAIFLARNGVHAIALVINAAHRFTSSQVALLKEIELFDDLWPFMFIIFSAAKSYGPTDEKQRERVYKIYDNPKCPENLKTLLDRVNKRFIMLESTEDNQNYRAAKCTEFLNMIDSIYYINQRVYSNRLFKRAIELYEKEKEKEKNKEKEYQDALNKVETLTKQMNEEMEKIKAEQEKEKQLLKEKFSSDEKRLKQKIAELKDTCDEKIKRVEKDRMKYIKREHDNASRIFKAEQEQTHARIEAELRAEREAREQAEHRALRFELMAGRRPSYTICNLM